MCGIAGFLGASNKITRQKTIQIAKQMENQMIERGPDSGNVWMDDNLICTLVHRRLSIIDLSVKGSQPMISRSGRFVISYNGEVYNFKELQKEFLGSNEKLRGHSDTEVILECIEKIGVIEATKKLIGMFAFAVFDRKKKLLSLVRDRVGIKPVYWTLTKNNTLIFGSRINVLKAHPEFSGKINRNILNNYMRHGFIPAPYTIYENVFKLLPGSVLNFGTSSAQPDIQNYWSIEDKIIENKRCFSDMEAISFLNDLLDDSVKKRMIADVPLGAFLSGGVDSSTVVAFMQKNSFRKVKTFSIGFNEANYNEAQYAKKVADHLGTDHTELYLNSKDARDFIPKIPDFFDEPFADSSQIPTFLISKLTRKFVTVSLSGDGGDELFAGYNRYPLAKKIERMFNLPKSISNSLILLIECLSPNSWNNFFKYFPKTLIPPQIGDKLYKLALTLKDSKENFYRNVVSIWLDPSEITGIKKENKGLFWENNFENILPEFYEQMQLLDLLTYLPDDILTKVDRASMAVSLEARVPLLDHRIIEFAWSLNKNQKLRNGKGKWILRELLYKYVPKKLIERPKMGFGVPIDNWLRTDLREWAEYLLSEETFKKHKLLLRKPILNKWEEHLSGKGNWHSQLWNVLMLHAWAEKYGVNY